MLTYRSTDALAETPTRRQPFRPREALWAGAVLLVGAVLRLNGLEVSPGYDWDEPVYVAVAQHVQQLGYPALVGEGGQGPGVYLFHPPFDFYVKALWFTFTGESTVESARILSALGSIVSLLLVFVLVRRLGGARAGAIALVLASLDGWLVFINRTSIIENTMIPIGILAMLSYSKSLDGGSRPMYLLSGLLIGLAFIYKHTGACFVVVPGIYFLVTRKNLREHVILYAAAASVVLSYIGAMVLIWGNEFILDSTIQFRRSIGDIESRGLNFGIQEVGEALVGQYSVFFPTVLMLILGTAIIVQKTLRMAITRTRPTNLLLYIWVVSAGVFLGAVSLKSPMYLIILIIPICCLLAVELDRAMAGVDTKAFLASLFLGIVVLNFFTWQARFVERSDNAIGDAAQFARSTFGIDDRVLTEEPIGVLLSQQYFKLDTHRDEAALQRAAPTAIVLYYSVTQRPPSSPALRDLVARSDLLAGFTGYKEEIRVYRVRHGHDDEHGGRSRLPVPVLAETEGGEWAVSGLEE